MRTIFSTVISIVSVFFSVSALAAPETQAHLRSPGRAPAVIEDSQVRIDESLEPNIAGYINRRRVLVRTMDIGSSELKPFKDSTTASEAGNALETLLDEKMKKQRRWAQGRRRAHYSIRASGACGCHSKESLRHSH